MVNPREFQRFGLALRSGEFSSLSPFSFEWEELWREQYRRCIEGYSVGGVKISGALYYYVNFHLIQLLDERTGRKAVGLPELRDIEFEFFGLYERAKAEGKGLMMISGRRAGKSFMSSGLLVHNFIFHDGSKGCVGSGDQDKGRDLMRKVKDGLIGLKDTEFYIPLIKDDIDTELQSGWREKDRYNNWVPRLTDRVIYFRNFKNKHTAANGLSTDLFIFEEVGMFSNLIMSYNSSSPCWREGSRNFGVPVLVGTGGDMEDGSVDAQKMFEDPETYDLLSFEYEGGLKRAYFMPAWMALNDYKDEYGRSKKEEAIAAIKAKRERLQRGHNLMALFQEIQYYPLKPEEAFLVGTSNIFPLALLQDQIERVLRTPEFSPRRGFLRERDGVVIFEEDNLAREVDFPTREGGDISGCVSIYEEPLMLNGVIPSGLYVLGCDPYAQDNSEESLSLGSCFVYKRFYNGSQTGDIIVAEYTGRPVTMDIYHEGVRLLCKYYNGKVLYENNIPGLKQYFEVKRSLNLLHPQPDLIKDIIKETGVDRRYGVHMTKQMKLYLVNKINDWLLTPLSGDSGGFRLETIYSINLLRELVNFNYEEGNFDRVIAFGLCLIQDSEMFRVDVSKINDSKRYSDFYKDFDERHGWRFSNRSYRDYLLSALRF